MAHFKTCILVLDSSGIFSVCLLYIHHMFTICSLYVHYMFTICSLYVHCMFTICSLYGSLNVYTFVDSPGIFSVCLLYIHHMFTICSLYVRCMFTVWLIKRAYFFDSPGILHRFWALLSPYKCNGLDGLKSLSRLWSVFTLISFFYLTSLPHPQINKLKPGLHIIVTITENACGDASKRILKVSTYRLHIFLVKDQYLY